MRSIRVLTKLHFTMVPSRLLKLEVSSVLNQSSLLLLELPFLYFSVFGSVVKYKIYQRNRKRHHFQRWKSQLLQETPHWMSGGRELHILSHWPASQRSSNKFAS